MTTLYVAVAMLAVVASAAGVIFWKLQRRSQFVSDSGWDGTLDLGRYRPMERLLADEDLAFLAGSPLHPRTLSRIRTERRRIFERYLRNLESDFARLHGAARMLLLSAPEDRPDLASAIMRQQLEFKRSVWALRLRMYVPGFGGAASEVSRLLELANAMGENARLVRVASGA